MSLIGRKAPNFKAPAVIEGNEIIQDFTLENYLGKQEVLLFFYPKDFTFICPTELISFQENLAEFYQRGVAVVGCSTDTEETHLAWLNTPINKGGIEGVTYPLVADTSKVISSNFGVLGGNWTYGEDDNIQFEGIPIAYRGTFFIDKEGIIRHQTVNDLPIGRNIQEMLRIIDMWHHVNKHGEVCPANWTTGKRSMKPTPEGVSDYLTKYIEDAYDSMASGGCCGGGGCNSGKCGSGSCNNDMETSKGCCSTNETLSTSFQDDKGCCN